MREWLLHSVELELIRTVQKSSLLQRAQSLVVEFPSDDAVLRKRINAVEKGRARED